MSKDKGSKPSKAERRRRADLWKSETPVYTREDARVEKNLFDRLYGAQATSGGYVGPPEAVEILPPAYILIDSDKGPQRLAIQSEHREELPNGRDWVVESRVLAPKGGFTIPYAAWMTLFDTNDEFISRSQVRVGPVYVMTSDTLKITHVQRVRRTGDSIELKA